MSGALNQKQKAYEHIRQQMRFGHMVAGERVLDQNFANELGISRPAVREAIGRLESDGLVEHVPHYGTFVRKFSRGQVADLFELRILLEGHAAERAAWGITDDIIADLDQKCWRMSDLARRFKDQGGEPFWASSDEGQWIDADLGFHMAVIEASGNRLVKKIIHDQHIMARLASVPKPPRDENQIFRDMAWTWRFHRRVFRALQQRDGGRARYWVVRHLEKTMNNILAFYDQQGRQELENQPRDESTRDLIEKLERYHGHQTRE